MENVHEVASGPVIEIIQITETNFGAYSDAPPLDDEALLPLNVWNSFLQRVHWDRLECRFRSMDFAINYEKVEDGDFNPDVHILHAPSYSVGFFSFLIVLYAKQKSCEA